MPPRLSYWVYSLGFPIAWLIVLAIVSATRKDRLGDFLLVFAGAAIG